MRDATHVEVRYFRQRELTVIIIITVNVAVRREREREKKKRTTQLSGPSYTVYIYVWKDVFARARVGYKLTVNDS